MPMVAARDNSSGSGDQTLPTACPAGTTGEQPSGIFGAFYYDDYLLNQYHDYAPDYVEEFDAADGAVEALGVGKWATHNHHYGILNGGATSTCASFEIVQLIADAWEPLDRHPDVESCETRDYVFAGGESTRSKTRVWLPNGTSDDGIAVNVVPCTSTPLLIGTDMLRYYGPVLDYARNTVYNHRLKRYIPCTILKSGHLALLMTPEDAPEDGEY